MRSTMRPVLLLSTLVSCILRSIVAVPLSIAEREQTSCKKTKVVVLGAGAAGVFAAQALHNASVDDFMIIEYNGEVGGRVKHTSFGQKPNGGGSYTVELGANWIQGTKSKGGPPNPLLTLAKKWNLKNTYTNYNNLSTYDESGAVDYLHLLDEFENAYAKYEQDAGYILKDNLQDRSARTGFRLAGWKPSHHQPKMEAVEWYEMDFEYAQTPEQSSHMFSVVNYNTTFYQYSGHNNLITDPRGYSYIISSEASTFLKDNDPRLLLNTIVTDIAYSDSGVVVHTDDGSCIQAEYAICTFSVGVLQHDDVQFHPELPEWKRTGIDSMTMATYTKIFLQFPPDKVFWDKNTIFYLYADSYERGYYPVWESLDSPGFLEGSGIIFVTVVQDQSYQAEAQTDEQTKDQVMKVLRKMFGEENVPDPIDFMYPRWSLEPWAYGSYSNWPPSYTLEMHQNLRASVGRLWFAGEATSTEYYGFLHGAYFEGQRAGESIAKCINGHKAACSSDGGYELLHGTTRPSEYDVKNGWTVSSFLTYGF